MFTSLDNFFLQMNLFFFIHTSGEHFFANHNEPEQSLLLTQIDDYVIELWILVVTMGPCSTHKPQYIR